MLAAAIAATLPALRREAESLMQDTFAAYSTDTELVTNPDTGMEEEVHLPAGETRGKIQGRSQETVTQVETFTVGGVERTVVKGGLHIPYSAPLPSRGWVYQCTAVGDPINDFRIGRRWLVVNVPLDDATARRLDVVELEQAVG